MKILIVLIFIFKPQNLLYSQALRSSRISSIQSECANPNRQSWVPDRECLPTPRRPRPPQKHHLLWSIQSRRKFLLNNTSLVDQTSQSRCICQSRMQNFQCHVRAYPNFSSTYAQLNRIYLITGRDYDAQTKKSQHQNRLSNKEEENKQRSLENISTPKPMTPLTSKQRRKLRRAHYQAQNIDPSRTALAKVVKQENRVEQTSTINKAADLTMNNVVTTS